MRSNFTDQRHPIFFTSLGAPHKLEVHLTHAQLQFYEKIKEIEKMHRNFIRCHKSYVINTQNVRSINKNQRSHVGKRRDHPSLYPWIKEIDFIKEPNSLDRLNDQPIQTLRFFCLSVQKHFLCNFTSIHCIWIKCWPILHFFQQYFLTFISCI